MTVRRLGVRRQETAPVEAAVAALAAEAAAKAPPPGMIRPEAAD